MVVLFRGFWIKCRCRSPTFLYSAQGFNLLSSSYTILIFRHMCRKTCDPQTLFFRTEDYGANPFHRIQKEPSLVPLRQNRGAKTQENILISVSFSTP